MPASYKAFVSSTFEDLKGHRAFVINALRAAGFSVDPMEDWTADADEPRHFSVERLEDCDLCVLLVALRRGFVPPGETRSITQLEYEGAIARGIDVLPFLLEEDAPWPRRFDQCDDELKRWREELSTRHGRGLFGLEPGSIKIEPALTRWVTHRQRRAVEVGSDWVQLVSNVLGLSKNEPGTWAVAARLLPHALAAVAREYYGPSAVAAASTPAPVSPAPAGAALTSPPMRGVLAETPGYLQASAARYERACYVIMPFGRKTIDDGTSLDFDRVYDEVFRPAIEAVSCPDGAQLEAVRADAALLSGAMSDELLRYLEYSRLVVADISTSNADVFYQLGRRHRARESGTIMVAQQGVRVPFDLAMARVVRYSPESPSSREAARALLSDVLRQTLVTGEASQRGS